jgi:hypothetical protein
MLAGLQSALTPQQVVAELERNIVGQSEAKRAVAIALRALPSALSRKSERLCAQAQPALCALQTRGCHTRAWRIALHSQGIAGVGTSCQRSYAARFTPRISSWLDLRGARPSRHAHAKSAPRLTNPSARACDCQRELPVGLARRSQSSAPSRCGMLLWQDDRDANLCARGACCERACVVQLRQDRDSPAVGRACASTVHQGLHCARLSLALCFP